MPIVTSFPSGTPIWVDLQSPDQPAAAAYYRALFDWEVTPADPRMGGYSSASLRGVPVGALGPLLSDDVPSMWTTYFAVPGLHAAAQAVEAAGGTVLLPPGETVPGVFLSIVQDPAGAVFGIWEKRGDHRWLRDEPGAVDWVELVTPEPEAVFPFYEAVLGVGASEMRVGDKPYGLFDVGDNSVAGVYEGAGGPSRWLVYVNVADLDAAVVRATELGGTLALEPLSAPGVGRWAEITDPQGAAFALLEPEREPD
ncbi:VOC family protein [Leifsonia sp. F6_8S_P_1B]|uniref:VOC family protein n=1 Tax=Leifsonia williamsii TaxID=3035919 RepID=A0ABT8KCV5_9MICO|nr:VOC family protein [Leifsonia williamsii]MDN4614803.1 VOC family protein [Leifsonia williamsii]